MVTGPAPNLRPFSTRGWLFRNALERRGTAVLNLDPQGRADLALISRTRQLAPLLMRDAPALQILACARAAARLGGAMAEAGVLAGGSARLICEAKGNIPLHLFDVFETLQQADEVSLDAGGKTLKTHFGAIHGTRRQVGELLATYPGVHLHPGIFPASAANLECEGFSFVHLDLDLARSTRDALEFFHPRMVPGGILLGDDYNLAEVRESFEDYFAGRGEALVALPWSQVMVVKGTG
jgi:hypothetical protein